MKFLRTGAWYEAQTKQLSEDLSFDEFAATESTCNCKQEIESLKKEITKLNDNFYERVMKSVEAIDLKVTKAALQMPVKKETNKSDTAKKK